MPQSRKWQLTFNNPAEHGFTHDAIVEAIENLASVVYWCLCDETGSEGTYHTHLYICFQNPKLLTVKGGAPMSELVHFFVRLGWSPATVFCVVFIGGLAVGLTMAAVIGALVHWIFECAFSKSQ